MPIIWISIAVSGVFAGLLVSRAALTPARFASSNNRRHLTAMASVWALLLLVFLLTPLVQIPLGTFFEQVSSRRLFSLYRYSSVFAVCFFGTCLVATLATWLRLLFRGAPRNGA